MNRKKIFIKLMLTAIILCLSVTHVSATNNNTTRGYIWNQLTGEVKPYDQSNYQSEVDIPVDNNTQTIHSKVQNDNVIKPKLLYMYQFIRYTQTSATLDWEKKYVGVTRVDNSRSSSPTILEFQAQDSGTWEASISSSFETSAELDAVVAKVNVTSSIGGTVSRSWTSGFTYGAATTVPAYTIGKVEAYIPGTSSAGYARYKVTNTSNDDWWYSELPLSGTVPAKNAWNFKVTIPCP